MKPFFQYLGAGLLGAYVGYGLMEDFIYRHCYEIDPRTELASIISIHAIGAVVARHGTDEQLEDWYDMRHGHMNPDGSWTRLSTKLAEQGIV